MKAACYSILTAGILLVQACHQSEGHSQQIKTLDSLSGAVNAMEQTLVKTDTILLQKCINRLNYYSTFINENVHDTISREQADNLKHFYDGGQALAAYAKNRQAILKRARLINAQLMKLSEDTKDAGDPEALWKFISIEKAEASRLMEAGQQQQEKFHSAIGEFKNALHGVEQLIKSRNRGELPTIVKDTVVL